MASSVMSIIDKMKRNPLVKGILYQVEINHPGKQNELQFKHLYIIIDDDRKYLEEVTGERFYAHSNGLSNQIDSLENAKRGYEGAIESPDIVPGPDVLYAPTNWAAVESVSQKIEALNSSYSYVKKNEDKAFNDFKENHDKSLKELIKELEDRLKDVYVTTTHETIFEKDDEELPDLSFKYRVLFDRLNMIQFLTLEERFSIERIIGRR